MPTYQYQCNECKDEFEEFQSMVEPALENCTKCGGKVRRLISGGAGFLFKGSGFYITDYRNSNYKKDSAMDNSSGTSATSKTNNKSSSASKSTVKAPASKPSNNS